jgi:hypothetical protein
MGLVGKAILKAEKVHEYSFVEYPWWIGQVIDWVLMYGGLFPAEAI